MYTPLYRTYIKLGTVVLSETMAHGMQSVIFYYNAAIIITALGLSIVVLWAKNIMINNTVIR